MFFYDIYKLTINTFQFHVIVTPHLLLTLSYDLSIIFQCQHHLKYCSTVFLVPSESGLVTDHDVKIREAKLHEAIKNDTQFQLKEGALVEIAQV